MNKQEILNEVKISKCSRCGGDRVLPWYTKLVLLYQIGKMQKIGYSSTAIIRSLNELIDLACKINK